MSVDRRTRYNLARAFVLWPDDFVNRKRLLATCKVQLARTAAAGRDGAWWYSLPRHRQQSMLVKALERDDAPTGERRGRCR